MKSNDLIWMVGLLLLTGACSPSTEPNTKATSQDHLIPDVTYRAPSVDRTTPGAPTGSPFPAKRLSELFPLDAGGLERYSAVNGVPQLTESLKGSESRIIYKHPQQPPEITLEIRDSGTQSMMMDQIVDWVKTPRNTQSDNTLEKTGALHGFPYYERYVNSQQSGEIRVLVNRRFEVVAKGNQVPLQTLREVVQGWELGELY